MRIPKLNKTYLILALSGGILLSLAWPPLPFPFLLFIGFVPFLILEEHIRAAGLPAPKLTLFKYSYFGFLVWNVLATWWVWNSTEPGAVMAFLANSLFMTVPLLLYQQARKTFGDWIGPLALIVYWLSFEFVIHRWELAWTWLSLGNGFARFPAWIQWYEYTGIPGGTLWALLVNFLIFRLYQKAIASNASPLRIFRMSLLPLSVILLPLIISLNIYHGYEESGREIKVTVVQPNIDPYNEKFGGLTPDEQLDILLQLSEQNIDEQTDYLVWPETSLQHTIWLDEPDAAPPIQRIRKFIDTYPGLKLVAGFAPFEHLNSKKASPTAREYIGGECCYDAFNSALYMQADEAEIEVYHKSKLVIGVERIPYPALFKFLEPLALNLGGTTGSLGIQDHRGVFVAPDGTGVGPAICFESVFGEYLTDYIKNGAHLIFIITNDGWWGNTPGHVQHMHYASLRCIETRRSIARSANTGISCFINQRGDILQPTDYDEATAIRGSIRSNKGLTFYVRYGDVISRIGVLVAVMILLVGFVYRKTDQFKFRITRL